MGKLIFVLMNAPGTIGIYFYLISPINYSVLTRTRRNCLPPLEAAVPDVS